MTEPLTQHQREQLGRWLTEKGFTLADVAESLVEWQRMLDEPNMLLSVWEVAARNIRIIEGRYTGDDVRFSGVVDEDTAGCE